MVIANLAGGVQPGNVGTSVVGGVVAAFSGAKVSDVVGFVVKDAVLTALPLMALAPIMALVTKSLGKLAGFDGAPPPMAGFLLLGPGAWSQKDAIAAQLAVGNAIYAAHGVPSSHWPKFGIQSFTPLAMAGANAQVRQAILEADKEWHPALGVIVAINEAYEAAGAPGVIAHLKPKKRTRELLELQFYYAKATGKGTKKLLQMIADVEAAIAAQAKAAAPKGLENAQAIAQAPAAALPAMPASAAASVGPGLLQSAVGALGGLAAIGTSSSVVGAPAASAPPGISGAEPRSSSLPLLALGLALVAALVLAAK